MFLIKNIPISKSILFKNVIFINTITKFLNIELFVNIFVSFARKNKLDKKNLFHYYPFQKILAQKSNYKQK